MMSQRSKYLLFVFFLIAAIDQKFIAAAEETTIEGIITRPVMEYKAAKLHDPFGTYLTKEAPKEVAQETVEAVKPEIDINKLKVQGIIWGVKNPQAIINDKVLKIGDLIEGAEIVSIEKKGITLNFKGTVFDLTSPGQDAIKIKKEIKKEDK